MNEEQQSEPLLRVVKGEPTYEELAALTAVVSARRAAPSPEPAETTRSAWAAYWRTAREPIRPGPGGWRASALPR